MPSDLTGGGAATGVAVLPGFEPGECIRGTEWGNRYPWSKRVEPAADEEHARERAACAAAMGHRAMVVSRHVVTYATVWAEVDRG